MRMRRVWAGTCLAAMVASCGGGTLTVSEYAEQVEDLVAVMEAQFASLDSQWESHAPTVDGARAYWDGRLEIRYEFLENIRALDAPAAVTDQHTGAIDVFTRITEADEALAARVATLEAVTEHREWLATPEGEASLAVLEEVYAFCRASQAEFDATEEGESFGVDSWLSPEMREAVRVAFGCPPQEAG